MNTLSRVQGMIAIAALVIGGTGVSHAQSNPAPDQKQKPAAPKKTEVAPKATPEEPKNKGAAEGIKVHGHWTIEVRDPDGKVATHREFENKLSPTLGSGGAVLISELMLGQISASPSGFEIALLNSNNSFHWELLPAYLVASPPIPDTGVINVTPSTSGNPPVATGAFTLSGSVVNASQGTLSAVATEFFSCPSTVSPSSCSPNPYDPSAKNFEFTSTTLNPTQQIQQGQTIAVTVVISFQ
jgi:hypothetical protein